MRPRIFPLCCNAYAYIYEDMRRIEAIRRKVLKVTQAEMADIAGVKQATISRWEEGKFTPSLSYIMAIKAAVADRAEAAGFASPWKDEWLVELNSGDPDAVADEHSTEAA